MTQRLDAVQKSGTGSISWMVCLALAWLWFCKTGGSATVELVTS